MDVRERIETGDIDLDSVWEHIADGPPAGRSAIRGVLGSDGSAGVRERHGDAFVDRLEERLLDDDLSTPHDQRVRDAFRELADGDWAAAEAVLLEDYESVCEAVSPALDHEDTHPVACHLYDQPPAVEEAIRELEDAAIRDSAARGSSEAD